MKKNISFLILGMITTFCITAFAQVLTGEEVFWDIYVDGEKRDIEESVVVIDDKAYLPIRAVSEVLGKNVIWIKGGNKIIITSPNYKDENLYLYEENNLYGYKDYLGNVVIKPQFSYANDFSEGLAAASSTFEEVDGGYKLRGKMGYIDAAGKFVIPEQYDNTYDFHNGIALVSEGLPHQEVYHYINKQGEALFGRSFELADSFSEGFAVVLKEGPGGPPLSPGYEYMRKYAYINTDGQYVNDMVFEMAYSFNDGYAIVKNQGKWGLIDKDFNLVIDYQYETAEELEKPANILQCAVNRK